MPMRSRARRCLSSVDPRSYLRWCRWRVEPFTSGSSAFSADPEGRWMVAARQTLATAIELITIPQAMALLVEAGLGSDEARLVLTGALLNDKLRGGDLEGPGKFRELSAN